MTPADFRAGAAHLSIEPPLGLPMVGFVRQPWRGTGYGLPLEVTALVLEREGRRVVVCGLDVTILKTAAADRLVDRIAAAVGADPAGVLVNVQHSHLAPLADRDAAHFVGGDYPSDVRRLAEAWMEAMEDKVVSACLLAAGRLEPARVAWAVATVDEAVNRRERAADGRTVLGWNPDGLVDTDVVALQARRRDGTAIGTVVGYGCHPVTTGYDMSIYSADYPGALRETIRRNGGGDCVFLQGAGGNVLPRVAFTTDEREAERVGRRLALSALAALAGRGAAPRRARRQEEASTVPIIAYRVEEDWTAAPALEAAVTRCRFALAPLPSAEEIAELRADFDRRLEAARASGDVGRVKIAHVAATWARGVEEIVAGRRPLPRPEGPVHAVRIGEGAIVTGPGETFTEIGLAVRERSPGLPTLYAGYTNGCLGYFSTASEYAHGGYEPGTSHRGYELPAPFDPGSERLLVETGVRLVERLWPGRPPWPDAQGWTASGVVPEQPPDPVRHPGEAGAPGEPRWSTEVAG